MAKRGELGRGRSADAAIITPEVRDQVGDLMEKLFQETKLNTREAEIEWGIDKSTISKTRNKKKDGPIGVGFLVKLRALVANHLDEPISIDDLLLLPPLPPPRAKSASASADEARDRAAELARKKGVPEHVIAAVVSSTTIRAQTFQLRTRRWADAFAEAAEKAGVRYTEHHEIAAAKKGKIEPPARSRRKVG